MAYAYDYEFEDPEDYNYLDPSEYEFHGNNQWLSEDHWWRAQPPFPGEEEFWEDSSEDYGEPAESDVEANYQDYCDGLPEICRRHNSRAGCPADDCRRLHICQLYLAKICKFGHVCRYGHSLTTMHNQMVCSDHGLSTKRRTVEKLMSDVDLGHRLPLSTYHNQLEICFKTGSANPCDMQTCNRLHICRNFVLGTCQREPCRFGHDLSDRHNEEVLDRHQLSLTRDNVIDILYEKYSGGLNRGSAGGNWDDRYDRYDLAVPPTDPGYSGQEVDRPPTAAAAQADPPSAWAVSHAPAVDRPGAAAASPQGAGGRGQAEDRPATSGAAQRNGGPAAAENRPTTGAASPRGAAAPVTVEAAAAGSSAGGARRREQQIASADSPPALAEELTCPICLDLLQRATTLNCGHTLCAGCLEAVREADPKCPMCRCRITSSVRSVTIDNIISRLRPCDIVGSHAAGR